MATTNTASGSAQHRCTSVPCHQHHISGQFLALATSSTTGFLLLGFEGTFQAKKSCSSRLIGYSPLTGWPLVQNSRNLDTCMCCIISVKVTKYPSSTMLACICSTAAGDRHRVVCNVMSCATICTDACHATLVACAASASIKCETYHSPNQIRAFVESPKSSPLKRHKMQGTLLDRVRATVATSEYR